jgi:glycosyltransferase involved in cell wall biosynthesis
VVPPGSPDALAAAMTHLTELSGDARLEMAQAARELALTRFDLNVVTAQWERLYLEY